MVPDFQSYLESIRATYDKWWELYTLTDAAGRQRQAQEVAPTFDFSLMVRTVKREERGERREEEKIERLPVLEGIRKYADQQVLLVGRPGSGKSTALARLMLEEATKLQARIPVLVELRYWQGSIEQLIQDSFARHGLRVESLERVLERSLILFDGMNELPSEEARSQLSAFRRNHPELPMIFTTRDLSLGGDLGIEKKLEMQPLTEAQMQAFVRAYLPEQADQMLRQLKDRLREFGQTPLLLWMLCSLFQQTGTIPENLGLVFREFTQGYERYLKEDVRIESDRSWWKPVLQQLAWVMMKGEKPTEFRIAIRKEEAVRAIAEFLDGKVLYAEDFARKCLRDLLKYHLIQAGASHEEIEFRHQLIREYYAAEYLLNQLHQLSDEELKQDYLNYLKWTESIILMLGLIAHQVDVLRIVHLALEVDLLLGAKLVEAVKLGSQCQNNQIIINQENLQLLELEVIGNPQLLEYAIKVNLESPGFYLGAVTRALQERYRFYNLEIYESRLNQQIDSEEPKGDPTVINVYGSIGTLSTMSNGLVNEGSVANNNFDDNAAAAALLKIIQSTDEAVRLDAIEALGKTGGHTSLKALIKLLEDAAPAIRAKAAEALGQLGSVSALEVLIAALNDSDSNVRAEAAEALGHIGSNSAMKALIAALDDPDLRVQASVARALGKLQQTSNLTKAAQEIQELLGELGQDISSEEALSSNQVLMRRIAKALKAGGIAALANLPFSPIIIASSRAWNKDE